MILAGEIKKTGFGDGKSGKSMTKIGRRQDFGRNE